jgi:hypothetical protein
MAIYKGFMSRVPFAHLGLRLSSLCAYKISEITLESSLFLATSNV